MHPKNRDLTETITLLARFSRFIIADITETRSVPHELASIIPLLAVPVLLIYNSSFDGRPFSMLSDYWKYDWVISTEVYQNHNDLLNNINKFIKKIEKNRELLKKKREVREKELR